MATTIRKPACWENSSLEDLMRFEAGQAYVLEQFGSDVVTPDVTFRSSRKNQDAASYDVFEDGSLWFHNNSQDEVHPSAFDWVIDNLTNFQGAHWEESDDRDALDGVVIDDMEKNLLMHLWGDEQAKGYFARCGGIVDTD